MEEIINKIFSKHNTTALKVKPYAPLTKVSMTAVEVNKLIQELPSEEVLEQLHFSTQKGFESYLQYR